MPDASRGETSGIVSTHCFHPMPSQQRDIGAWILPHPYMAIMRTGTARLQTDVNRISLRTYEHGATARRNVGLRDDLVLITQSSHRLAFSHIVILIA